MIFKFTNSHGSILIEEMEDDICIKEIRLNSNAFTVFDRLGWTFTRKIGSNQYTLLIKSDKETNVKFRSEYDPKSSHYDPRTIPLSDFYLSFYREREIDSIIKNNF